MDTSRREFLGRAAATAAMFGGLPLSIDGTLRAFAETPAPAQAQSWDLTWVDKLKGKHKAVFDVPEVESGYGVWRASIWGNQYNTVLNIPPQDLSAVIVLRHNGIALAMQQSFWDTYGIGKAKSVLHPITQQPTDRNPALLSSTRKEVPEQFDAVALDKFIARGGVALGCDLAFQDCIELVRSKDNVTPDEAKKRALAGLVPGVVLQPSGVFAVIRAQEAGCTYIRAS